MPNLPSEPLNEDLDAEGYLKEMASWTRARAEELAEANDIGPLTDQHWQVIEFVKDYYQTYGQGHHDLRSLSLRRREGRLPSRGAAAPPGMCLSRRRLSQARPTRMQ